MNDANKTLRTVARQAEIALYVACVMIAGLWLKSSALDQDRHGEKWGWYPTVVGTITGLAACTFFILSALALRKARLASDASEEIERLKSEY